MNLRRILGLIGLSLIIAILPETANAAVFNQQDVDRVVEVAKAIQSLTSEVAATLKSLPSYESEKIGTYAIVELNLEATRERWNTVVFLVLISSQLGNSADEARILNLLYKDIFPETKKYLISKKNYVVSIGRAQSDSVLSSYSGHAANLLENQALPLLDQFYRRLVSIPK
jgi:hypothetical protein